MKGYVTLGTNNLEAAVEFYEQLLAGLGISRGVEFPGRLHRCRQVPMLWRGALESAPDYLP